MGKPIELHFWPTPNGRKISIALEEMKLRYVVRPLSLPAGDQFKPEFLAISPNGKMPAIVDPKGPGGKPISVFESGAILQYLGCKTGKFYPRDERKRTAVDEWLMWQMSGVGPVFGQAFHFRSAAPKLVDDPAKIAYAAARFDAEVGRLCAVLDRRLEGRPCVAGEYSIADMAIFPWARLAPQLGQDMTALPHLSRWLDRVGARAAVRKGLAIGEELRRPPAAEGETPKKDAIAKQG